MSYSEIPNDPSIMRLAHPLRCPAAAPEILAMFKQALGSRTWGEMEKAFQQEGTLSSVLVGDLCDNPEHRGLAQMVGMTSRMGGGTEVGNAFSIIMYLRHALAPQPYFVLDDSLCEMLENTDIADDIPMGMLTMPFSRCYVEFGKGRKNSLIIPNVDTGNHLLEGSYIEFGKHPDYGDGYFIMLTGSPLGKENAMDDATHSLYLPASDPNMTIKDALLWTHRQAIELSVGAGLRQTPTSFIDPTFESLLFLTKALLYISLAEARKEVKKDYTEWKKSFAGIQSSAKKNKALRRSKGLVDHILVTAPPAAPVRAVEGGGQSGRSVKGHWRRGHLRSQAYGPQYSQRKIILLRPMLIHGGTGQAPAAQYSVR